MRSRSLQLVVLLSCMAVPTVTYAQPTLNGATLFQANATGDNKTADNQFHGSWRTNPGIQNTYHNLFLTPNADASYNAGSFYNNGSANLSQQLSLGLNTFYFYSDSYDALGNAPNWGLNLWFGTTPQSNCADSPIISALALTASNTFAANNSASTATQCNASPYIQGANALSVLTGGYTVTMQSFQMLQRSNIGGTINRVSSITLGANALLDNYGVFTLNVTQQSTVPEPSTYALMFSGLAGICIAARRRKEIRS